MGVRNNDRIIVSDEMNSDGLLSKGAASMPLVRLDLPAGLPPGRVAALAEAVHRAMVETIDVPERDRFQVITEQAPERLVLDPSFPEARRSPQASIVHITLRRGRSEDKKRALFAAIARGVAAAGHDPDDIMVVLAENEPADWAFAAGIAHYAQVPA
jgi:phenylpyruvate tautomerase PptA (4-oxalocrotonate tautomerase family)